MFIEKWKLLMVAATSLLLVFVFFLGIKPGELLLSHDELIAINYFDALRGLYVRSSHDFNVDNTTILTVTIIDRLYYFLGFSLHMDLQTLEKLLYFLKLFIAILVPYIGFKKFVEPVNNTEKKVASDYVIWLITFLYAFNTYSTIYWHGNGFQLSLLLCYSLAPLALYYFREIISNPTPKLTLLLKEALIFLLMSFGIYFFAVFAIVLSTYYFSALLIKPSIFKSSIINIVKLVVLCTPLYAIFLPMFLIIIFGGDTVNATGGETFTNLQGGLLYPLFFWFSWGIYTDWTPKNIFTFSGYYRSFIYLLSTLAIYTTVFLGLRNKINIKNIIHFLLIFLVTLTLVKGAQPPFQEIYLFLIKHFPPFRVFRSPDNKFGFGIILSLCFLLMYTSGNIRKRIYISVLVFIVLVQSFLVISGVAIRGQNTRTSSDRIIHIPDQYSELVAYIDSAGNDSGYILPVPPTNFGHFILSPTEKHLGQDLILKLTKNPVTTPDEYSSMPVRTYRKIKDVFENDLNGISDFPIKYFLFRKDLEFVTAETDLNLQDNSEMSKVFENGNFELYENINAKEVIEAENVGDMSFSVVSPVEYKVHLSEIRDNSTLILNNNFNQEWEIYISKKKMPNNNAGENKFSLYPNINSKVVNAENIIHDEYANQWDINKNIIMQNYPDDFYELNPNGETINADITIYYHPQTNFYILSAITLIFVLTYATFIFVKHD